VILNLAIWFAIHTIFRETVPVHSYGLSFDAPLPASADPWALALAAAAVLAIFRFKFGMLWTLAGSCAAELFSSASAFYDDARLKRSSRMPSRKHATRTSRPTGD